MRHSIKLLPITEEEQSALLMAVTLVLNSIDTMKPNDSLVEVIMKTQTKPLLSIREKLEK